MEERVFIQIGYTRYAEIVRVDQTNDGWVNYAYADRNWGVSFVSDCGQFEREVCRERDLPAEGCVIVYKADVEHLFEGSKYGSFDDMVEGLSEIERRGTFRYGNSSIYSFVDAMFMKHLNIHFSRGIMHHILTLHQPIAGEGSSISFLRNCADAKRKRVTTMKPGRAFRHMFPKVADADLAAITEAYIEHTSPREFTLHVSKDAKAFARAYDHERASYRNPSTTSINKSLATSCMQGVGRDIHGEWRSVGECYASGDFDMVWLEDDGGRIAGRVLVGYHKGSSSYVHGPVYGSCDQSIDKLHEYLAGVDASYADHYGFVGLKLKLIGGDCDPLAPYLDGAYGGIVNDGFIEIVRDSDGEFALDNTDGYITQGVICESCEDRIDEDMVHSDDYGSCYCEHCFYEIYTVLDNGDTISQEDAIEALSYSQHSGRTFTTTVHIEDTVYIDSLDETWLTDDCEYISKTDEYFPSHLRTDDDDMEEAA